MKHTTIWIDHAHAYIFEFSAKGIEERDLKNDYNGPEDKEHLKKFFHKAATTIGGPSQLLIVGPGTAKDEFKHHCQDHHHTALDKVIVGTETMKSHPSKAEILTVSRKFFNHYFSWHNTDV
jgi:stalled ribosome rescue protein Dom34